MTTVARITDTEMMVGVDIDEVTQSTISVDLTAFYASEFDEVTSIPVAMRYNDAGVVITSGELNEVDTIN